ncbi:hypothetical protein B0919_23995 [Hymenobacter sp. CRA2]|nr:hypothetical protein B0919_23995 [Hymenobacter sp. CRA2]
MTPTPPADQQYTFKKGSKEEHTITANGNTYSVKFLEAGEEFVIPVSTTQKFRFYRFQVEKQ